MFMVFTVVDPPDRTGTTHVTVQAIAPATRAHRFPDRSRLWGLNQPVLNHPVLNSGRRVDHGRGDHGRGDHDRGDHDRGDHNSGDRIVRYGGLDYVRGFSDHSCGR